MHTPSQTPINPLTPSTALSHAPLPSSVPLHALTLPHPSTSPPILSPLVVPFSTTTPPTSPSSTYHATALSTPAPRATSPTPASVFHSSFPVSVQNP